MSKKSLHENLGIFIGRLLAQNELTSQPTGSLRFGRVSIEKQRRRAEMSAVKRTSQRILLRHRMGVKLSTADQNFMKSHNVRVRHAH